MAKASKDPLSSDDLKEGQPKASSDKERNDKARLWNAVAAQQTLIAKNKELMDRENKVVQNEMENLAGKKELLNMMMVIDAKQAATQQLGLPAPDQMAPLPEIPPGDPNAMMPPPQGDPNAAVPPGDPNAMVPPPPGDPNAMPM